MMETASTTQSTTTAGTEATPKSRDIAGDSSAFRAAAESGLGARTATSTLQAANTAAANSQPTMFSIPNPPQSWSISGLMPVIIFPSTTASEFWLISPLPLETSPYNRASGPNSRSPRPTLTSPRTGASTYTSPKPASISPPTGARTSTSPIPAFMSPPTPFPFTSLSPNPEWTSPSTAPSTVTSP